MKKLIITALFLTACGRTNVVSVGGTYEILEGFQTIENLDTGEVTTESFDNMGFTMEVKQNGTAISLFECLGTLEKQSLSVDCSRREHKETCGWAGCYEGCQDITGSIVFNGDEADARMVVEANFFDKYHGISEVVLKLKLLHTMCDTFGDSTE